VRRFKLDFDSADHCREDVVQAGAQRAEHHAKDAIEHREQHDRARAEQRTERGTVVAVSWSDGAAEWGNGGEQRPEDEAQCRINGSKHVIMLWTR
jgi:hypothetical protein